MFSDKTINIHYRTPTSKLLKVNTFNEFELSRLKKMYTDQMLARRLHRSKSTRLPAEQAHQRSRMHQTNNIEQTFSPEFSEFNEQNCQYHNPNVLSQTPFVDLNRYQRAFLNTGTSNKSTLNRSSSRWKRQRALSRFGRALFDFQAKNERELSLRRGDLVELLEITGDRSWVKVEDCQSGLQGLVPLSYIDYSVGCAVAKRDISASSGNVGICSIRLGKSIEKAPILPMNKGEPITLIRRLTGQHCYEASNTRQALGVVWSSDLEIIKQPVLTDKDYCETNRSSNYDYCDNNQEAEEEEEEMFILDSGERLLSRSQTRPRAKSATSSVGRRVGCCGRMEATQTLSCRQQTCCCSKGPGTSQATPRRSSSSPYISSGCQDKLLERGQTEPSVGPSTQQQFGEKAVTVPRLCRVKHPYKARQSDEIDLVVGQILMVVHECDDGWFIGCLWDPDVRSQLARKMATFPGNFVESI